MTKKLLVSPRKKSPALIPFDGSFNGALGSFLVFHFNFLEDTITELSQVFRPSVCLGCHWLWFFEICCEFFVLLTRSNRLSRWSESQLFQARNHASNLRGFSSTSTTWQKTDVTEAGGVAAAPQIASTTVPSAGDAVVSIKMGFRDPSTGFGKAGWHTHFDASFTLPQKDHSGDEPTASFYYGNYLPHNTQIYADFLRMEQVISGDDAHVFRKDTFHLRQILIEYFPSVANRRKKSWTFLPLLMSPFHKLLKVWVPTCWLQVVSFRHCKTWAWARIGLLDAYKLLLTSCIVLVRLIPFYSTRISNRDLCSPERYFKMFSWKHEGCHDGNMKEPWTNQFQHELTEPVMLNAKLLLTGLPWWASIACMTIVMKTLLVPFVIKGQRNSAAMTNVMPEFQKLQLRIKEARNSGNMLEAAKWAKLRWGHDSGLITFTFSSR